MANIFFSPPQSGLFRSFFSHIFAREEKKNSSDSSNACRKVQAVSFFAILVSAALDVANNFHVVPSSSFHLFSGFVLFMLFANIVLFLHFEKVQSMPTLACSRKRQKYHDRRPRPFFLLQITDYHHESMYKAREKI